MAHRFRRARDIVTAFCCLGVLTCLNIPGTQAATAVDEVIDKVEATCARVQDVSARFQQTATNRTLGDVREASGVFLAKRPGKMRWEYQKPEPRLFVTDGKTLWAYSPADKQVLVQDVAEAMPSRVPLSFLAGDCALRKDFTISLV